MDQSFIEHIKKHLINIEILKQKFDTIIDSNNDDALTLFGEMRYIHGCAEHDFYLSVANIKDVNDKATLVKLSIEKGFLCKIDKIISKAEKKLCKHSKSERPNSSIVKSNSKTSFTSAQTKSLTPSKKLTSISNTNSKIIPVVEMSGDDTELLSLKNIDTEQTPTSASKQVRGGFGEIKAEDLFEKPVKKSNEYSKQSWNNGDDLNLTEYIDNISTTEANNLVSNSMSINRPTLVYYWADWCPYSIKFNPEWERLKNKLAQVLPNLQISDLNVKRDKKLVDMAKQVGVTSYPSLALFIDGQVYTTIPTNKPIAQIIDFIKKYVR